MRGVLNLALLALGLSQGLVVGDIHDDTPDLPTEFSLQLFGSGVCVLHGIMQQGSADHVGICDMSLVAEDIGECNRVTKT